MMAKMERELERVKKSDGDRGVLTDHGINFAWTAWHMADWVWADMTDAQRRQVAIEAGYNPDRFGLISFQPYLCEKKPELAYCRIIATAAKHSECRFGAEVDFAPDISLGPTFHLVGTPGIGIFPPQHRWVLKMDIGSDRIPALVVFESVLTFWTEFSYGRQIDRDS
jgi:hypothetical protein